MKKPIKSLLVMMLATLLLLSVCPATSAYWFTDEARDSAVPLTLDVPMPVYIADPEQGKVPESKWFKFTPEEDGEYWYVYRSEALGVLPQVRHYDSAGNPPDFGIGFLSSPEGLWVMWVVCTLEAGSTYYLGANVLSWEEGGDYTTTVTRNAPENNPWRLVAPEKVTLKPNERIYIEELLKGSIIRGIPSAFEIRSTGVVYSNSPADLSFDYFYGIMPGKGTISIDSWLTSEYKTATIEVTIEDDTANDPRCNFTLWQWFCYIFLGGWIWMK